MTIVTAEIRETTLELTHEFLKETSQFLGIKMQENFDGVVLPSHIRMNLRAERELLSRYDDLLYLHYTIEEGTGEEVKVLLDELAEESQSFADLKEQDNQTLLSNREEVSKAARRAERELKMRAAMFSDLRNCFLGL